MLIELGLGLLALVAVGAATWWRQEWLRSQRAIREWSDRWSLAIALCAVPGCLQPPEADCHVSPDLEVRSPWGHRFLEARLVPAPEITVREAIGAYR